MEDKNKEIEGLLEKIKENDNIVKKLVIFLENNNLLEDFYEKIYYIIEKNEPIYKIRYYKDEDGKLLSLYDIKNSDVSFNKYEGCSVYVYDEIKTLLFEGYEINKNITRHQEHSKSYNNLAIKLIPLSSCTNLDNFNLVDFIKSNPLLFVYTIASYNININELDKIDIKSYTYKKEIKKN